MNQRADGPCIRVSRSPNRRQLGRWRFVVCVESYCTASLRDDLSARVSKKDRYRRNKKAWSRVFLMRQCRGELVGLGGKYGETNDMYRRTHAAASSPEAILAISTHNFGKDDTQSKITKQ